MNLVESISTKVRHLPALKHLGLLWNLLRPLYQYLIKFSAGKRGLLRMINGMDEVRILPEWRALPEVYEPEVWRRVLPGIKRGDCITDIGAHFGLYAIAFAKRAGAGGCVLAVEADPMNVQVLRAHVRLNQVENIVMVIPQALSDREGEAEWHSQDMQSVVKPAEAGSAGPKVKMTTLDRISEGRRVDVVLVDIEGYEEAALRGGRILLMDKARRPRLIVIEVHPYNWHLCGSSSVSLLSYLRDCGYVVTHLDGSPVAEIVDYGHVFATPKV
jgi:FkbM family methyltransferase